MKTTLLFLSFLFISLSTYSHVAGQLDPVRDIAGDVLQTGVNYYILPVIRGSGGGLTLASTRNETCPLDVVQSSSELDNGLPLTFTPVNSTEREIHEATDLNIKSSPARICRNSTVWKLDQYDGESIVTTGGVEGNPGRETLSNWFRFEKVENDYKIVFCPNVCFTCGRPLCGDIGISVKNEYRRLAYTNDVPFLIEFKKA